jgi:hypothetical protein
MNSSFDKLTSFLDQLESQNITYTIAHHRSETVMVLVAIPGERWEIDFFSNGTVEIERFRSSGTISDESVFPELFAAYADNEVFALAH